MHNRKTTVNDGAHMENESETEQENEPETVSVWDKDGNEYVIPIDVLKKYAV